MSGRWMNVKAVCLFECVHTKENVPHQWIFSPGLRLRVCARTRACVHELKMNACYRIYTVVFLGLTLQVDLIFWAVHQHRAN